LSINKLFKIKKARKGPEIPPLSIIPVRQTVVKRARQEDKTGPFYFKSNVFGRFLPAIF